jgi:MoaA/NifB/PqqE/SkfB family radical SAM enzyme/Flp pilus assembly protein TadD
MTSAEIKSVLDAAINLHSEGKLAESESLYRWVLSQDQAHPDALNLLGMIAYQRGKGNEGLPLIEQACRLLPKEASYKSNLGLVLSSLGRHIEAETALRSALHLNPNLSVAWFNLGTTLAILHRPSEACHCFEQALRCDPNHPSAANSLDQARRDSVADNAARESIRLYAPGKELALIGLPHLRQQTSSFTYAVEVAEACNLRCPSCPQGNLRQTGRASGLIEKEVFRRILRKIRRESPVPNPALWFFSWGEPFLHPALPELICMAKAEGMYCMLSTNLNIERNIDAVLAACPDEIKVSLSGFSQSLYSATHVRGNIERVKNNLRHLRAVEDKVRSGTRVWVSYHLYRHNISEHRKMEGLVRSLGFGFNTQIATVQPLEKMIQLINGLQLPEDREFVDRYLVFNPLKGLSLKKPFLIENADCEARYNMMSIGHDGQVDLCCNTFEPINRLHLNFLEVSHGELQAAKYRHPFCSECYAHGLQMQVLPDHAVRAIFRAEDDAILCEARARNLEWR